MDHSQSVAPEYPHVAACLSGTRDRRGKPDSKRWLNHVKYSMFIGRVLREFLQEPPICFGKNHGFL